MNRQERPTYKTYAAIVIRNFVPFPIEQERYSDKVLALPLRLGLPPSVSAAEFLREESEAGVIVVSQFSPTPVDPTKENMAATGLMARAHDIIHHDGVDGAVYDVAIEAFQRVNVIGMGLHECGMFVAHAELIPESDVNVDVLAAEQYDELLSSFERLLLKAELPAPQFYSEEAFGGRAYPKEKMSQLACYGRQDLIKAARSFQTLNALTDLIAAYMPLSLSEKQRILDEVDPVGRVTRIHPLLARILHETAG
jgi:ATP-dependent Lon protease